jgi:N-acetylneuraminic acid mutarotase
MFGGQGFDSTGIRQGLLSDLWEFVPGSIDATGFTFNGQWVWQGGSKISDQPGVYGTLGVASASNIPGGRWGAATYTDAAGDVWLFGGQGYDSAATVGLLNDLWKYSGGQWTWMGGSNIANKNGIYGTKGTAAAGQFPGGRQNAVIWTDATGNVWVFGGFGLDATLSVSAISGKNPTLNDLWEFKGGQWIWISGSDTANQTGTYGTQLVAAAANTPGSRWGAVGWSDAKGSLWIFGGWGYDSDSTHGTGFLNDIWEYNTSTGQWKWWKGSSNVNQNGAYLKQGVSFVDTVPGARRGTLLWQPDFLHYVWIFGGQGYDATAANGNGYLSDLWTYLPYP